MSVRLSATGGQKTHDDAALPIIVGTQNPPALQKPSRFGGGHDERIVGTFQLQQIDRPARHIDNQVDLPAGARREALEQAMQGHVLEEAVLMGRYEETAEGTRFAS